MQLALRLLRSCSENIFLRSEISFDWKPRLIGKFQIGPKSSSHSGHSPPLRRPRLSTESFHHWDKVGRNTGLKTRRLNGQFGTLNRVALFAGNLFAGQTWNSSLNRGPTDSLNSKLRTI